MMYFNPRSPYGERRKSLIVPNSNTLFQSTLPLRGATLPDATELTKAINFNPRSPYGERLFGFTLDLGDLGFQSTLPLRGATNRFLHCVQFLIISIHAPLTGSDPWPGDIRRPRNHFNPRSPYGERLRCSPFPYSRFQISIHAPLTGSDIRKNLIGCSLQVFQSTLPLRGATRMGRSPFVWTRISIHAPLTGSDCMGVSVGFVRRDFNPRSPYGERRLIVFCPGNKNGFQSTLPLRGATCTWSFSFKQQIISIHAPLTGSDRWRSLHVNHKIISIHAPLTGSDFQCGRMVAFTKHFNPRSPYGERPRYGLRHKAAILISIHAPLTGSDRH